jgi:integrase
VVACAAREVAPIIVRVSSGAARERSGKIAGGRRRATREGKWAPSPPFPGARGGFLNLHEWRRDESKPAVKGAGLEHRSPYALRHTFASFAIAAGVPLFELSRFMGTSVEQIGETYGHLLPDSLERARTALDGFLGATESDVVVRRV